MIKSEQAEARHLVHFVQCPNCWHKFKPEEINFISRHPELIGDPIVGDNEYLRFLPNRFTVNGEAIDPRGMATADLACPKCHLRIPDALLEMPSMVLSITGSPASGKSYFLATMVWELRKLLPKAHFEFSDADTVANSPIREYEQTLFMNPEPEQLTEIRKTQTDDPRLYHIVKIDGVSVRYPSPLQFLLRPTHSHSNKKNHSKDLMGRVLILYDNAGEDFLPNIEAINTIAIQHLSRSSIILMLFDPIQDPRFQEYAKTKINLSDQNFIKPTTVFRQDTILKEIESQIKKYLNVPYSKSLDKIMIVIVPKADIWAQLAEISIDEEPYLVLDDSLYVDTSAVEQTSEITRNFLKKLSPDFVAIAENFSNIVRYIPISSLGTAPVYTEREGHSFYGIAPKDIKPKWVTVPLLYCLSKFAKGLIPNTSQLADNQ